MKRNKTQQIETFKGIDDPEESPQYVGGQWRERMSGGTDLKVEAHPPHNHEARQRMNAEIPDEMGPWLEGLAPWDWFSTYTFSRLATAEGAHTMFRKHLKWLELKAGQPVYAFRADEYGALNGRFHLHALIGNVARLTPWCGEKLPPGTWGLPCCGVHGWPCGHARVLPYDPEIGAGGYVAKYITKELGDFELIGFPASPQPVLQSG